MTEDNSKEILEEELLNVTGGVRKLSGADYAKCICRYCKGQFSGVVSISYHLQQSHGVSFPLIGRDYTKAAL